MVADLDALLARPSRAAWRELRHHWTALGLARLEDDAESLDYSVGGVLAPLARSGPWLDEPV